VDFAKSLLFCYTNRLKEGELMNLVAKNIITPEIFIPYGVEIELENVSYDEGERVIAKKVPKSFKIGVDNTLDYGGIEIRSSVLENTKENIVMFKKLSKTLKFLGATYDSASFQTNLDAYDFSEDDILNFLKMFSVYENIVIAFHLVKIIILENQQEIMLIQ